MAEGVNVRFSGALRRFVEQRSGETGLYGSASEYIRDLVRRDFEREENRRWEFLRDELRAGMEADRVDFVPLDDKDIITEARRRRNAH
jgi:antitoxin ParD1/3/4